MFSTEKAGGGVDIWNCAHDRHTCEVQCNKIKFRNTCTTPSSELKMHAPLLFIFWEPKGSKYTLISSIVCLYCCLLQMRTLWTSMISRPCAIKVSLLMYGSLYRLHCAHDFTYQALLLFGVKNIEKLGIGPRNRAWEWESCNWSKSNNQCFMQNHDLGVGK